VIVATVRPRPCSGSTDEVGTVARPHVMR
jgi:hypothetical protein